MPWVLYHDGNIQTRFMWFEGPNEPTTAADELRMLPSGCSMKLLSMHKEREVAVDNAIEKDEIVLASVGKEGLVVHVVNHGEPRDVRIRLDKLPAAFSDLKGGKVRVKKYLIDREHGNCLSEPEYPGGIEMVEEGSVQCENGNVLLIHTSLQKDGILLWEVRPTQAE